MASKPLLYSVVLTKGAERDLETIYDYIAEHDSPEKANYLLDQLIKITQDLTQNPTRGRYPKELVALGIKEYRQVSFKPYRVIYRLSENQVIIYVIADGRREMQAVLARRLLGA